MSSIYNILPTKAVEVYLKRYPASVLTKLRIISKTISKAAPGGAEEVISYVIPGYKYHGVLIFFAAFENHLSIYPAPRTCRLFKNELQHFKEGGKEHYSSRNLSRFRLILFRELFNLKF